MSHPVLYLPPLEAMGKAYFTPLMSPTPVATRLPRPESREDTTNGFLRIESGGGYLNDDELLWEMGLILHGYSPDEVQAEQIICDAVARGAAAQGLTTTVANRDWYVTFSRASALPLREEDPRVNLPRYRAMVTWRIPGKQD